MPPSTERQIEQTREELIANFFEAIGLSPGNPPSERDRQLMGYSDETKVLIVRAIELDPALHETILAIAEHAYADGADSIDED